MIKSDIDPIKQKRFFITGCLLLILCSYCNASEVENQVEEVQKDIALSKSATDKFLGKDARLVPIPIPISNPTIGTGLALALVYMHPQKSTDPNAPTTATGIAGMYTNTDSWAVGGLHDGYYRDDTIRFRIPVGYGEFNLDFYGIGNDSPLKDNPVEYNAVSNQLVPRVLFRLPWDNWFLGGEYRLINIDTQFDTSSLLPNAPGIGKQAQTAGLGFLSVYDSRDSNFWPSKGSWLDLSATQYGDYAGGDFDYLKIKTKWAQYFPLANEVTLVYRLDGQFIDGDAPFWDLSQIQLRGYAGGRFLDDVAITAQTEVRWNFYKRWTTLAFVGGGRIAESVDNIGSTPTNWAGGAGFKYMLVEKQKLQIGIDLAFAEGGNVAVYFQVGDWLSN